MIKGFSKETAPLNDYETRVLLPVLIAGLKTKTGRKSAAANQLIEEMRDEVIDAQIEAIMQLSLDIAIIEQ